MESDYNGWSNRATWNVSLWLNNDEAMYRHKQETIAFTISRYGKVVRKVAMALRIDCVRMWGSKTPDGCALSRVNWTELAESELADL